MHSLEQVGRRARSAMISLFQFNRRQFAWLGFAVCALMLSWALAPLVFGQRQTRGAQRRAEPEGLVRKRAEWFFRQRANPQGFIPAGERLKALEQIEQMRAARGERIAAPAAAIPAWKPIGPQPTVQNPFNGNTSGRVTALAVDPHDATGNTVYLGAAGGGVWKTLNGGTSWTPLTDFQPSLAVGSIALDTVTNPNQSIIYVGTGEDNFGGDNIYGAGVLKSTDGGQNWTVFGASAFNTNFPTRRFASGPFIGAIAVQPRTSSPVLLAALRGSASVLQSGIWRSTNGGMNWTHVLPGPTMVVGTDVVFDPSDLTGKTAYAALGNPDGTGGLNGVYKSIDAGANWVALTITGFTASNFGRISLAVGPATAPAPATVGTVFAAIAKSSDNSTSLLGILKSVNGGTSWTNLSTTGITGGDFCKPQCFYDLVVGADPANSNIVFVGGAAEGNNFTDTLFRSTNGGTSWDNVSFSGNISLHVDHHALAFTPNGSNLYVGNDGGAWSSTNVVNPNTQPASVIWNNLNTAGNLADQALNLTQFYPGGSIGPTTDAMGFGGTQDNGMQMYNGTLSWILTDACGDGGWTAIDPSNTNNVYVTCVDIQNPQFIVIAKSVNGGQAFNAAQTGITVSDRSDFIPPMVLDTLQPRTLYFGTFRVYHTTDGAATWTAISNDLTGGTFITTIAVAPSDSNTVFAGTDDSRVWVNANAGAGQPADWNERDALLPPRPVTQIAVDPGSAMTAYVTFSGFSGFNGDVQGHVFKTINAGTAWVDISGNMPNIPVNDLVVDPGVPNTLYAATDLGVLSTSDGGATWSPFGAGLPNVEVLSLKMSSATRTLRAGTHGRGAWDLQLPVVPDFRFGTPAPGSQTVLAGNTTSTYTIPVTSVQNFTGPVTLSCSGLPVGAMCNFTTNPVFVPAVGMVNALFTISTSVNTPAATTNVTVTGMSGSLTHTASVTLVVNIPDFAFGNPSPTSQTVSVGQKAQYTFPVNSMNGFSGSVMFSCSNIQPATTDFTCIAGSFTPNPLTVPANPSTTLSITPTANARVPVAPGPRQPLGLWIVVLIVLAAGAAFLTQRSGTRRRLAFGLTFALAVVLLAAMSACGGGSGGGGGGVISHTFTITVQGTAAGTPPHTTPVTLTIQ